MVAVGEVAQRAGVSTSTVSHVLNGTRFVSAELRARVQAAVEDLDYQPNAAARSLSLKRSNAIGLIVANVHAMTAAISLAGRIDADAVLQMHRALLGDANPSAAGRWRDEQVWIGGSDYGPHGADYVAPHHSRVEAAIDDLVRFIDREDVPILAHAALAHAQFETIHPFTDGNGRTGRALLHAQLCNKGLTRHVTVPVSAGFLTDTDAYFAALTSYRAGDPIPIVERLKIHQPVDPIAACSRQPPLEYWVARSSRAMTIFSPSESANTAP